MSERKLQQSSAAGDGNGDPAEMWLVLRAQAGDREAMESLIRRAEPDAARYIDHLMGSADDHQDVLQVVLLTIVKKVTQLHDPRLFRAWMYRICSRESFRALRAMREWNAMVDEGMDPDATPSAIALEDRILDSIDIPAMLGRLSLASRTVVSLHYLEGLSQREIAEALGLRIGTVKSRLAYGLAQLRSDVAQSM
ncbi:MAG: sigma-70 family RNA polymerase sigma factor [Gemmatimonadaceae bacterium]|nr:sigma-70 family RNA polymerase sigma factor [Gemmatimonadaceae bacterium]